MRIHCFIEFGLYSEWQTQIAFPEKANIYTFRLYVNQELSYLILSKLRRNSTTYPQQPAEVNKSGLGNFYIFYQIGFINFLRIGCHLYLREVIYLYARNVKKAPIM